MNKCYSSIKRKPHIHCSTNTPHVFPHFIQATEVLRMSDYLWNFKGDPFQKNPNEVGLLTRPQIHLLLVRVVKGSVIQLTTVQYCVPLTNTKTRNQNIFIQIYQVVQEV